MYWSSGEPAAPGFFGFAVAATSEIKMTAISFLIVNSCPGAHVCPALFVDDSTEGPLVVRIHQQDAVAFSPLRLCDGIEGDAGRPFRNDNPNRIAGGNLQRNGKEILRNQCP